MMTEKKDDEVRVTLPKEDSKVDGQVPERRERVEGIVFSRAFCTLGMVAFHFSCHSAYKWFVFNKSANADLGVVYVSCFFAISGAVLYHNYPANTHLKSFFYKRWKSMYPAFYLTFFFFFTRNVFGKRKFWYKPVPQNSLILTFLGVDGFLMYKYPNYYVVGEWFFGAIVLLYLLYPVILFVMNKVSFLPVLLLAVGTWWVQETSFFVIAQNRNLITCALSFAFGMLCMKYKNFFLKNKICGLVALAINLFLYWKSLTPSILLFQLQGLSLFIVSVQIGEYLMKTPLKPFFTEISSISLGIFMSHHPFIYSVRAVYNPKVPIDSLEMLGIVLVLSLIYAKVLSVTLDALFRSKLFVFLDSFMLDAKREKQ